MNKTLLCAGVLSSVLAFAGMARGAELGMPAPELAITQWVKGQPVALKAGKGKTIYVIEFWATWCPPCRKSIPHLTDLQKQFADKGVVIIGVSDEEPGKVKPFVTQMGDKMSYTVAVDDARQTSDAYMKAFGENGIPHAFVVNKDGLIAWHGHPMAGLTEALAEMVSGKFDLAAAKKLDQAVKRQGEYFAMVTAPAANPRAAELGGQLVTDLAKNPGALNEFAWRILADRQIKARDLGLALRAAKIANDSTGGTNVSILDTYAHALFETGKRDEAVKLEECAVKASRDERERTELEATLARFKRTAKETAK